MDQCTHEVRTKHWKSIIESCQNRPAGQSIKSWLDENGIPEQSYYYWQRKFRKAAYNDMTERTALLPVTSSPNEISFAEVPVKHPFFQVNTGTDDDLVAVVRAGSLSVGIKNGISDTLLAAIIREVSHA